MPALTSSRTSDSGDDGHRPLSLDCPICASRLAGPRRQSGEVAVGPSVVVGVMKSHDSGTYRFVETFNCARSAEFEQTGHLLGDCPSGRWADSRR